MNLQDTHPLIRAMERLTLPLAKLYGKLGITASTWLVSIAMLGFYALSIVDRDHRHAGWVIGLAIVCIYNAFAAQQYLRRVQDKVEQAFLDVSAGKSANLGNSGSGYGIIKRLTRLHTQIQTLAGSTGNAANEVSASCRQLDSNTAQLSRRAEEIASMLEESASAMEEFSATVERNMLNTREASQRAQSGHQPGAVGARFAGQAGEGHDRHGTRIVHRAQFHRND